MAEQTFGTGFDELLVVAEGELVRFVTQGHDQEELDHDEVRKLIEFLQEIVGGPGLAWRDLELLEPLEMVKDRDGQTWRKTTLGDWHRRDKTRGYPSMELVERYGPIRKVG